MTADRPTICRRCSAAYAVPAGAWLPACPRCGRAPVGLRARVRDNRLAAVLATLAAFALAAGFTEPFLTMDKLGQRTSYSLLGGVLELLARGYAVIGTVLLVFSVLFPIAKLVALLLATSRLAPLPPRARHGLHRAAELTGKWSMLDVLVVAVIIVLVRFDGLAHVEAHAGTVWFCAAVLASMLAGLCVDLPASGDTTMTQATPDASIVPPRASRYAWRLLMLVPAVVLGAYGYWRQTDVPSGGTVTAIRLTTKSDIAGQVRDAYEGVVPTTADLYLKLARRDGATIETPPFADTPLGNGLTWTLDAPLALGDLAGVEVWDANALLPDKQLDRVELGGVAWESAGQTFAFRFIGTRVEPPLWALPLAAIGATLGAVVVLRFVWDQAL